MIKYLKIKFFINLILFILPFQSFSAVPIVKEVAKTKSFCTNQGGIWRWFNNNCADLCSVKFKKLICARTSLKLSCDCVALNKCWNDEIKKCQDPQEYEPFYAKYLEESKIEVEKRIKIIKDKIKKENERLEMANKEKMKDSEMSDKEVEKLEIDLIKHIGDLNNKETLELENKKPKKNRFININ